MLDAIELTGFKSLGEVSMQLGQVNVLVGPNGSGKSNLLEALGVLGAAASGRVDDQALLRRGIRPGVPALYKASFRDKRFPRFIKLKAKWVEGKEAVTYEVGLDNPLEKPKPAWTYSTESISKGDQRLVGRSPRGVTFGGKASPEFPLSPDAGFAAVVRGREELAGSPAALLAALDDFAIFAPTTPVLRGIVPDSAPRVPVGLFGGRLAEAVGALLDRKEESFGGLRLSQIFDLIEWADDVAVAPPSARFISPAVPSGRFVLRFSDRRMHTKRNILSGYDASEGALYVLFMLVLAMHSDSPRIYAIDNFDHAMNPRLARSITKLFCDQVIASHTSRQVLLTTHSPLALDGLNLADDRIRLFIVDRGRDGLTTVKRVEVTEEVLQASKDGMTLSRLWVSGRLGGVPDL